ncbi:MAG: FixH family protein [Anaerolineales bacterium]|nr:FixH family protein [Anaerolineales bacterium]
MRKFFFISMFVLASVLLSACGGGAAPAADGATEEKPVNIQVETSPSPAMMGDVELVFTITDANGSPIEGATVDVSVDHTDMTGMGMSGVATDQGGGQYSIKAGFSMSGNWKLTVYVRKDGLDFQEDIDIKIQ